MSVEYHLNQPELQFETAGIRKLSLIYRAIDHPVRLQILQLLHQQEHISVFEIGIKLELGKETVSQHLGVLRKAALVNSTRHARFQYYSLNYNLLEQLKFPKDLS